MLKTEVVNGRAALLVPYNKAFRDAVKEISGAEWDRDRQCWTVPETKLTSALKLIGEHFSYPDLIADELIQLKLTFECRKSALLCDVAYFGKVLAHADGPNGGAKPGRDVTYLKGGASSDGNNQIWYSCVNDKSVAVLKNVSSALYERTEPIPGLKVDPMGNWPVKRKLMEEKGILMDRVVEIDQLIKKM